MADATVKVNVTFDFTGLADSFRSAAEAVDALQAHLASPTPDPTPAPAPAPVASASFPEDNPPEDNAQEDPQGP
jgi:hypothetical protein